MQLFNLNRYNKQLNEHHPLIVFGGAISATTAPVTEMVKDRKDFIIISMSTITAIKSKESPLIFATIPKWEWQAPEHVDYVVDKLGIKSVTMLGANDELGLIALEKEFGPQFERRGVTITDKIFGLMAVLNIAHGEVITLGAFTSYHITEQVGLAWPFSLVFATLSRALLAAVMAGLGEFGYNNIVITPEYGPRIRFNSVLTEAEFDYTPLIDRKICLRENCGKCLSRCTSGAIQLRDGIDNNQIFLTTPSKTDNRLCVDWEGGTVKIGCYFYGTCLRVCPIKPDLKKTKQP